MESDDGKSSSLSSLFSYSNLVHAVSGATGSVIAISVFYPLDTVRTRLQVDDHRHAKNTFLVLKEILKEEGLEGVYLGWFPVVSALCCSNFVYFYTYNGLKSSVLGGRKKASPIVDLTLAFLSALGFIEDGCPWLPLCSFPVMSISTPMPAFSIASTPC
uniref:Uncharacterized protein n=1 Tax=Biomphalaria glabrata TaxID=6526 RepID=A0A2C9LUL5_BIOGL